MDSAVRSYSSMKKSKKSKKSTPSPPIRRSTRSTKNALSPLKIPANRTPSPSPILDDKNSSGNSKSSSTSLNSDYAHVHDDSESKYCGDLVRRKINLEPLADNVKETQIHSRKKYIKRNIVVKSTEFPTKHSQDIDKVLIKNSRKRKNKKDDHNRQEVCIKKTLRHRAIISDSSDEEDSNFNDKMSVFGSITEYVDSNSKYECHGSSPEEEGNSKQINLNKKNGYNSPSKENLLSLNEKRSARDQSTSACKTDFDLEAMSERKNIQTKETNGENMSCFLNEKTVSNGLEAEDITKMPDQCAVGQNVVQNVLSNDMANKPQEEILELNIHNHSDEQQVVVKDKQLNSPNYSRDDSKMVSKSIFRKLKTESKLYPGKPRKKEQSKLSPRKKKVKKVKLEKHKEGELVNSSDTVDCLSPLVQFYENEREQDCAQKSEKSVVIGTSHDLGKRNDMQVGNLAYSENVKIRSQRKISHSENKNDKTGSTVTSGSDDSSSNINVLKKSKPDKDKKEDERTSRRYKNKSSKRNPSVACPNKTSHFKNNKLNNNLFQNSCSVNVSSKTMASAINKKESASDLKKKEQEINNGTSSDAKDLNPKPSNCIDSNIRKTNELSFTNSNLNEDANILGGSDSDDSLFFKTMKSRKFPMKNIHNSSSENKDTNQETKAHAELEENRKIKSKLKLKTFALKGSIKSKSFVSKTKNNAILTDKTCIDSSEKSAQANCSNEGQNNDVKNSDVEFASTFNVNLPLNTESTDVQYKTNTETMKIRTTETVMSDNKRNRNGEICSETELLSCDKTDNNELQNFTVTESSNSNNCVQIKNTMQGRSLESQAGNENNFKEKKVNGENEEKFSSIEFNDEKSNYNSTCKVDGDYQIDVEITNDELIFSDNDDKLSISPQFSPVESLGSGSSITKPSEESKDGSNIQDSSSLEYSGLDLNESFSCDESEFLDIGYSPGLTAPVVDDKEEIYGHSSNEDSSLSENETKIQFSMKQKLSERDFKNKKMKFIRKRTISDSQIDKIHYNAQNKSRKLKQRVSITNKESPPCSFEKEPELVFQKSSDSILDTDLPIVEVYQKGKSLGGIMGYNDGCDYLKVIKSRKYISRDSNNEFQLADLFKKVLRPLCRDMLLRGSCEKELLCNKKHQIRKGCFNHLQMDDVLAVLNFVLKLATKVSESFMIASFEFLSLHKAKSKILGISSYIMKWDMTDLNYYKNVWGHIFDALQACSVEKSIAMKSVIYHNFTLLSSLPIEKISRIIGLWNLQCPSLKNVWHIVEPLMEIDGFILEPPVLSKILSEVMIMKSKDIKRIYKKCVVQILGLSSSNFNLLSSVFIDDFIRKLKEVHLLAEAEKIREKVCHYNTISYGRLSPDLLSKPPKDLPPLRRCKSVDRLHQSGLDLSKDGLMNNSQLKVFEEEKMEAAIERALECSNYSAVVSTVISCYKKSYVINILCKIFKYILNEDPLVKIKKMLKILQEAPQFEDCKMHFGALIITFIVNYATTFQWEEADNFFSLFDEFSIPKYDVKPLQVNTKCGTSYSPVRIAILYSEIHFYNRRYKDAIGVVIDLKLIYPPEEWGLASTSEEDADWINVMVNFLMADLLRLKVTDIATMLFKCLLEAQMIFNSPIDLGNYFEPLLYNLFELVDAFPETAIKLYIRVCNKYSNVQLYGLTIRTLLILAYKAHKTVTVRELFLKAVEEYAYPIFEEKENTIFLFKSFSEEEMYVYITEWLAWFRKKLHERSMGTAAHEVKVRFKNTDLEDFLENKALGIPAVLQEVDQSIQGAMKRLNKVIKKCHLDFNKEEQAGPDGLARILLMTRISFVKTAVSLADQKILLKGGWTFKYTIDRKLLSGDRLIKYVKKLSKILKTCTKRIEKDHAGTILIRNV